MFLWGFRFSASPSQSKPCKISNHAHFTGSWHSVYLLPPTRKDNGHTVDNYRRVANALISHMSMAAFFILLHWSRVRFHFHHSSVLIISLSTWIKPCLKPQTLQVHESVTCPFQLPWFGKLPVPVNSIALHFLFLVTRRDWRIYNLSRTWECYM